MKKYTLIITVLLATILAACAPATTLPQYVTQQPVAPTAKPTVMLTAIQSAVTADANQTSAPEPAKTQSAKPVAGTTDTVCVINDSSVNENDWTFGPASSSITIIEYSDFQCPYCAKTSPVLQQLAEKYPNDVQIVYRYYPLSFHSYAMITAMAAEAAGMQKGFWPYAEALFAKQDEWSVMQSTDIEPYLLKLASSQGLDADKFKTDMNSDVVQAKIKADMALGDSQGVTYTPFIMLNGMEQKDHSLTALSSAVDSLMQGNAICPLMDVDLSKTYTATIETTKGNIVINLLGDSSPYAVTNFIQQAKGNAYKDRTFYKIINDTQSKDGIQVVLAGNENGSEASYTVRADQNTLEFDRKGLVGMADSTNFFITLATQKKLTGSYVVFGEVTSGMKIVEEMTQPGLVIQNITITEK